MLYDIDINYGRESEILVLSKIKKFFNDDKFKELDYYHEFDYTNEDGTILCELKSRRCNYNEYNDTMLNVSKLNKCKRLIRNKNKKIKIFFFFLFKQDQLYFWEYNDTDDIRYGEGGRVDRSNAFLIYNKIYNKIRII